MKAESTTQVLMIDDDENDAMLVRARTSGGDGSRTVSLPAIVRRNVFTSADHLSPGALLSDLDTFFALRQLSHGYDLRPTALISDLHDFFAR